MTLMQLSFMLMSMNTLMNAIFTVIGNITKIARRYMKEISTSYSNQMSLSVKFQPYGFFYCKIHLCMYSTVHS